ncbi:MAG: glycine--tRNA ligase subunit beta, partial [Candidatus Eisenbacteria bacterium]
LLELLFEIGTEEIPPSYVRPALKDLASGVESGLESAGVEFGEIVTLGTPRRMVLIIRDLAERALDSSETVFGPPVSAAFDGSRKPTKAALGFAKSQGVDVADLKTARKGKGDYVCIEKLTKGGPAIDQLGAILRAELTEGSGGISFPKTMKWEKEGRRFARPIRWMALVVDGQIGHDGKGERFSWTGIEAGDMTRGHRFLGSQEIKIKSVDQYLAELKRNFVIVDHEERKKLIGERITEAAATMGGVVVEDDELLERVTFTVEYPLAVTGSFSPAFMQMPAAVIVTALKEHQDFFSVSDADGKLLPNFVAVANMDKDRSGKIKEGNERVLKARLEDAHFYWQQDLKDGLVTMAARLTDVVWQEQLGSLREKSERVSRIAEKLVARTGLSDVKKVKRAADLYKADLTSLMVREKEFSSLQGLMGKEYANASGEEAEVAEAIYEHYLPRFAGDILPSTPTGTVLALAERLDTLVGCFGAGMLPTGSQDPYGLRRQATGFVRILAEKGIDLDVEDLIRSWTDMFSGILPVKSDDLQSRVVDFIQQRVETLMVDEGYRLDMVRSVVRHGVLNPAQMRKKLVAIRGFEKDPRFEILFKAFKRGYNITQDVVAAPVDASLLKEDAERDLYASYQSVLQGFADLVGKEQFHDAMALLLELSSPIDVFFDEVMVMAEDEIVRANRLNLLANIRDLFLSIADFSRLEVG